MTIGIEVVPAFALILTTTGSLLGLGWWLNGQFRQQSEEAAKNRENLIQRIEDAKDAIDDKILYHEKLDDERFASLQIAIMKIELREERQGRIVGPNEV